jgi:hypothetical protein
MENQEITSYEFTAEGLADYLGVSWESFRKNLERLEVDFNRNDLIPANILQEILKKYAEPHHKRPVEVNEKAKEAAGQLNIQININNNRQKKAKKQPQKPVQTNDKQTVQPKALPEPAEELPNPQAGGKPVTALVYFAFIFILLYQVEHLATIGMDVSAFPAGSLARKVSGWLFAVTVSITALLMTLRRGIKARVTIFGESVSYLMVFAILDVIFFVLSSAPLEQTTALHWIKSLLVGITTAFVIYSFNELITKN